MSAATHRVEIVVGTASAEQRVAALSKQFSSLKGASNNASDAIDDLAQSATNLGTSIDKNGRLRDANGRFVKMGKDAKQASQSVDELAQSTRKLGDSADYTSRLLGGLKGMMAGYFSLAGLGNVLKTADAMQTQNAQIKLVTESTEQYIAVKEQLFQIAQSTRQDIEATTTAYTNNARSLQQLGKNQSEILKFTESVSLAMAVGGKSAQEQASALVQLGQAMQSGVLQGDEFRSIAENAPILLDLVAKSLNKTRAEVKKLASDGKISAEVIYNAMAGASEELKAKYAAMPVTMNQALNTVQNQYKSFVDDFMNGTGGISEKIASAILWVNEHFNSLVPTMAGLTAIYGGYLAMNTAFVASIPAKVAGLAASTTAFYQESMAMNANAAAKARAVMANVTLTNAASAMVIGVSRAGIAVMNAAGFIDRKTASVVNASRSLVVYSANLVRTNGVLGATRLAIVGTTTALVAQARAVMTSNAAKVALTATTRTMAGVMTTAGRAIASVGAIIKAHPIMIFAGIIATVITATMGLEEAMESFGDAVTVVGMMIQDFVKWSVDGFTNKMGQAIDWVTGFFGNKSKQCTGDASKAFSNFFGTTEGGFLGVLQVIGRSLDVLVGAVRASLHYTGIQVDNLLIRAQNAKNRLLPDFMGGGGEIQAENNASFGQIFAMYQHGLGIGAWIDSKISINKANKQHNMATDNVAALGSVAGVAATNLGKLSDDTEKAKKGSSDNLNPSLSSQTGRMHMVFTAFKNAGFSDEQARQLTAQVGRENEYNPRYLFGTHTDANNGLTNIGMISWQGSRGTRLRQEMQQQGFIKNGKMVQSQEALDYQAKYLAREMANDPAYARTRRDFMQNPNPTYEKGMGALNDNFIRWDSAGKKINARPHHERQRRFYDQISNSTKNTVQEVQEVAAQSEKANEFLLQFTSQANRLAHERDELIKQAQSYVGSAPQEQIDAVIANAHKIYDNKVALIAAEMNFEINAHRMSTEEKMLREHEIYALKIALNEDYTSEEKRLLVSSAKEKYETDLALFKENEQRKRAEIDKTIKAHGQDYIRQDALSYLGRTSQGNQKLLELTYRHDDAENALNEQYEAFKRDTIYARDDNGNFLRNLQERQELEKQAEAQHYQALEAMHRIHIDEMQKQKDENLSHTLNTYGALADGMAGLFKNMVGEQSRTYRAMFAVSRAFALAEAGKNVFLAASKAYADTPGTVWQKMAAAAKATVDQGRLVALISAMQPKGFKTGGYTGNVGVNDIAGVVHGKEYVLNAQATKRIGTSTLDRLNNGGDIGGNVNITINVASDGSSAIDAQGANQTAKAMADRIKTVVLETLRQERKQGGLLYA